MSTFTRPVPNFWYSELLRTLVTPLLATLRALPLSARAEAWQALQRVAEIIHSEWWPDQEDEVEARTEEGEVAPHGPLRRRRSHGVQPLRIYRMHHVLPQGTMSSGSSDRLVSGVRRGAENHVRAPCNCCYPQTEHLALNWKMDATVTHRLNTSH